MIPNVLHFFKFSALITCYAILSFNILHDKNPHSVFDYFPASDINDPYWVRLTQSQRFACLEVNKLKCAICYPFVIQMQVKGMRVHINTIKIKTDK